jgi:hypothetical protein
MQYLTWFRPEGNMRIELRRSVSRCVMVSHIYGLMAKFEAGMSSMVGVSEVLVFIFVTVQKGRPCVPFRI